MCEGVGRGWRTLRGQQRSGYYGLCSTCNSRDLGAGAPLLPFHFFPSLLSSFVSSLSPLVLGHMDTRMPWASQKDLFHAWRSSCLKLSDWTHFGSGLKFSASLPP